MRILTSFLSQISPSLAPATLAAQPSGWYNPDAAGKPVAGPNGSKFVWVVLQVLEALQLHGLFTFRVMSGRGSQVVRPRSAKPLS